MVARLRVELSESDYLALLALSEKEVRDPISQIRFLIKQAVTKSECETSPKCAQTPAEKTDSVLIAKSE